MIIQPASFPEDLKQAELFSSEQIPVQKTNFPNDVLYENAVENGKNELEELIAKELLPGSRLIEKNITHEKKDEETVKVTVEMKFIENIAKQTQIVLN